MILTGKISLVTGAAHRVGKAIASALADGGSDLALHYGRSERAARQAAEEIAAASGQRVEVFQADLAEENAIAGLFRNVGDAFGRLDVLVNNAAVYGRTPIEALTAEQWDAHLAVNARAPALCIRHAIDLMPAGGVIINIADIAAEKARGGFAAYCASKAALLALTKSTAKALAPRNIRVNAVSPGVAVWQENLGEAEKQKVLAQVPLKRPGWPADVAAAVLFLVGNDYITGQNLRVDGGWHMA